MIGSKAYTPDRSIQGFITAMEHRIGSGNDKYLFSYFENGDYKQAWVYDFEIVIEAINK
jgi:hypothetical protein